MLSPKSLKNAVLLIICLTICTACLFTILPASNRYSEALKESLLMNGKDLAKSMAAQITDFVLINDITSIQKQLDRQVQYNEMVRYAFVEKDGDVLAHTFDKGIPESLVHFNTPDGAECSFRLLVFKQSRESAMDIACPVFEGHGGVLHLGLSDGQAKKQIMHLWLETAGIAAGILFLSILGANWLLCHLISPLEALTDALGQVAKGRMDASVTFSPGELNLPGQKEVQTLVAAFNRMSQYLKEKTEKVDRSYDQLVFCNEMAMALASKGTLQEIVQYLLNRFYELFRQENIVFFLCSEKNNIFLAARNRIRLLDAEKEHDAVFEAIGSAGGSEGAYVSLPRALLSDCAEVEDRQYAFPVFHNNRVLGLLVCTGRPGPDRNESTAILLMLRQAAGSLSRGILHEEEQLNLQKRFSVQESFQGIVGRSPAMQRFFRRMEQIAPTDATVLIQSESGTGKELAAHAIHNLSGRAKQPFVIINCAAYPDTLLESELFGYEKGAFTGADHQKAGRFEQAHGGTVFLDEIGEIPISAQVKLLRVLQSRTFERVGGTRTLQVDVRIIAATSRDLKNEIRAGRFREDLYYRLDVVSLTIPPLRERREDIPLLSQTFLDRFSGEGGRGVLSPSATRLLLEYPWPGNVRELENVIEQACILSQGGTILPEHLPAHLRPSSGRPSLSEAREEVERELIEQTLLAVQGNKKAAAERLNMSRTTLYAKMKRYGLS